MMTVHEVSRLTGVSIRTLQYYDRIGLLPPDGYTQAGYRLYDEQALERLQQILLFRELEFSLKEIREILDSPCFDRDRALEQQIALLTLKKEHLENLIDLARGIKTKGESEMDFAAFDTRKIEEYAVRAKASWGSTPEFREFEQKSEGRTAEDSLELGKKMMGLFARLGTLKAEDPASQGVQLLIGELQNFISEHFYTCSDKVLSGLGEMYAGGGEMTENIDRAGGKGTAALVREAIRIYCRGKEKN